MKWLLWKDFRLNLVIVIVAVILIAAPHVIALICTWYNLTHNIRYGTSFSENLLMSAFSSLIISQIVFAFLGGNAFAGERPDRSVEFLAYLPITRSKIIASKIILTLLLAALIWIVNMLIFGVSWENLSFPTPTDEDFAHVAGIMAMITITGLTFFCVAWFYSSFLESPTFSICIGLCTPLVVIWIVSFIVLYFGFQKNMIGPWYSCICLALAATGYTAGTWYYLRYAEP